MGDWAGFQSYLHRRLQVDIVELPPGAAAKNALAIWDQLERPAGESGAFFFKQRRWAVEKAPKAPQQTKASPQAGHAPDTLLPTHLLCRHMAYSFVHTPLAIIATDSGTDKQIEVVPYDPGRTDILCSVGMEDGDVILRVPDAQGVFVDGRKITGKMTLALGQALQMSEDDDAVRLIACL
jgi:hypothetical protein